MKKRRYCWWRYFWSQLALVLMVKSAQQNPPALSAPWARLAPQGNQGLTGRLRSRAYPASRVRPESRAIPVRMAAIGHLQIVHCANAFCAANFRRR